jgi:hypothetical protein
LRYSQPWVTSDGGFSTEFRPYPTDVHPYPQQYGVPHALRYCIPKLERKKKKLNFISFYNNNNNYYNNSSN